MVADVVTGAGKVIMIQGCGSDVGKSVITAGLCRVAVRRGWSVAPFKAQNMSNNAAACSDGGEIGRAQALQAQAANIEATVDMNPVLLKPQSDLSCQVVVHGKAVSSLTANDYFGSQSERPVLLDPVLESFHRLISQYDLVICEGAGSPAEINLRSRDIANMGFAVTAGIPVILVGDIDKGGVIAAVAGTKTVLDETDAAHIVGCIINKFRGDLSLFDDGVTAIERFTGWPCLGVIPWISCTARLPAEDAVSMIHADKPPNSGGSSTIRIAAPMLSRMANFDDADPLRLEQSVDFRWIPPGAPIPIKDVDVILLFGTKSVIGDMDFVRQQGWDIDIQAHARQGGRVLGLCGGYQMLGNSVNDLDGVDGDPGTRPGLGLLQIDTVLQGSKTVQMVTGQCAVSQLPVTGYEIHVGTTTGVDATDRPMLYIKDENDTATACPDGARSACGKIEGCYVHGLFASDTYRQSWLDRIRGTSATTSTTYNYEASVESALDELADGLESALDIDGLFGLAQHPGWKPI